MAFPTGNSGFPKASNAARMIDQALGVKGGNEPGGNTVCSNRDEDGNCLGHPDRRGTAFGLTYHSNGTYVPTSPEAAEWNGWYYGGQARKPALEPIYVGQKPFSEKNGALNILKWGVGAVNIDGCRVPLGDDKPFSYPNGRGGEGWHGRDSLSSNLDVPLGGNPLGRWPANLIHDGSPEVIALFPDSNGSGSARRLNRGKRDGDDWGMSDAPGDLQDAGTGTAARFFNCYPPAIPPLIYSPKASSADRLGSKHPTVKPQKLMRDIIKHGTPPGGIVLDPFCGTGSTLAAARSEGRQSIGIEADPTSVVDTVWRMTCDTR